ncbi:MAG: iron-sulfur cluster assembly scaffold protein [Campylobacterales bacterium]|nr:iron-sulfur cluster assembly scaffold protein [Campylobacterales bacterium]
MMNEELSQEILEHLMHPKNYGQIDPHNGVGMGYDEKSGEFVIVYLHVGGTQIENIGFATNGCQDTVVLGSMFTEMIKGDSLEHGNRALELMRAQMVEASASQQACAEMVLCAFEAARQNTTARTKGATDMMHKKMINQSCTPNKE